MSRLTMAQGNIVMCHVLSPADVPLGLDILVHPQHRYEVG